MHDGTIHVLLRLTAWVSVLLFLGAFAGEAAWTLRPTPFTRRVGERRRALLLGFVVSHTLHLGAIGALAGAHGGERFLHATGAPTLVAGGVVYLLIFGLAVSASAAGPASIGRARFDTVATWIVALALARPFLVRTVEWRSPLYLPVSLAFLAAFALRLAAAARRAAATPPPDFRPAKV